LQEAGPEGFGHLCPGGVVDPAHAGLQRLLRGGCLAQCQLYLRCHQPQLGQVEAVGLGQAPAAQQTLQTGVRWVNDTARTQVPEAFRASFLQRNPVNAALLALAAQAG